MATVVNTTNPASSDNGGSGFLIGIIILVLALIAIIYIGIPAFNRVRSNPVPVNVQAPNIVIPDKIDVQVNQAE